MRQFDENYKQITEAYFPMLTTPGNVKIPISIKKNKEKNTFDVFFGSRNAWLECSPQELFKFANAIFRIAKEQ